MGGWYLVDNELVRRPDPRLHDVDPAKKLSAGEFVHAIQHLSKGKEHMIDEGWAREDNDVKLLGHRQSYAILATTISKSYLLYAAL